MPETVAISSQTQPDSSVFDRWAEVYDAQSNPLLMLEERSVLPLLPELEGNDVLDAGCGTGRWLVKLERFRPASLTGTDCSAAMLEHARAKVQPTTKLERGECSTLPGENASKSFVLASFVLSYLDDLKGFAHECARVLRSDGSLVISDMHPATASERGWTRSFSVDGARVEIATYPRSLEEIVSIFEESGFEVQTLLEPSFSGPERTLFEDAGKLEEYEGLVGVAAIYILKLRKRQSQPFTSSSRSNMQLTNARIGTGASTWKDGVLRIEDGYIISVRESADSAVPTLDLNGYVLLPGLINAHEHLEFGLFPRLGRGAEAPCYRNSTEWAQEIHEIHADVIERYRQIPKAIHLWWGAIRNLLCGVTTVCHHNPLHEELTLSDFPVHVVSRFGWSHSLSFDPHLVERFRWTPKDQPFLLHAAEGVDEASRGEISTLDAMEVLDERTVLIHGLACAAEEIALLNRRGVSLVVCPTSNRFLFAEAPTRDLLTSVERLALGSDSPITAAGDLLDEARYLHTEVGLDPAAVYDMVTSGPAKMLHLKENQGQIAEFGVADLIAVRGDHDTPAVALVGLTFVDVELVVISGRVQMVSPPLYERLPQELRSGMQLLEVAGQQRWIRAPLEMLFEAAEEVLGQGKLLLAEREVRYLGTL
ncbi:methyltransferase domain-containing protein [Granulicella sp. dw_53]|uniref:methyltransferase domain-containing protein n=1 Tax=Granulicella sp. dw_53 TaxID=2719792 RepID=UPI001BD218FC|nr:methyltransferase domain-containing protein [Granulicella sp. dw_53]